MRVDDFKVRQQSPPESIPHPLRIGDNEVGQETTREMKALIEFSHGDEDRHRGTEVRHQEKSHHQLLLVDGSVLVHKQKDHHRHVHAHSGVEETTAN